MPGSSNPASSHTAANALAPPSSVAGAKKTSSSGESRDTASTAPLTPSSPSLAASPYPEATVEDNMALEEMAEKIESNNQGGLENKQDIDPPSETIATKKETNSGSPHGTETTCKNSHCKKHKCILSKSDKPKKKKKQKADLSSSSSDSSSESDDEDSSSSSSSSSSSDSSDTESITADELEILKKLKKKKAKQRAKKLKAKKARARKVENIGDSSDTDDEDSTDEDKAKKRKARKRRAKKLREAIESVDDEEDEDDDTGNDPAHQSRTTHTRRASGLQQQTGSRGRRLRYAQGTNSKTPPAQQRTATKAQARGKRASKVAFKRVDQREFSDNFFFLKKKTLLTSFSHF